MIYALHHVTHIARSVAAAPWSRSSWGLILNMPSLGEVVPGRVYRAGSPRAAAHFQQVRALGIKTIICVRYGGPSQQLREFAAANAIKLRVYDLRRGRDYDLDAAWGAATATRASAAQPVLICCDGGRHHAGIVVALLRLQMGCSLEQALAEYYSFASPSPFPDNVLAIVRAARDRHEQTRDVVDVKVTQVTPITGPPSGGALSSGALRQRVEVGQRV
jgi:hypothetical protein